MTTEAGAGGGRRPPAAATPGAEGISATLAAFVCDSDWRDVPEAARHQAKRSLLNFFGVALAGSRDSASGVARATTAEFAGYGRATVIGRAHRTDTLTAAFLNAFAANVHDFDDTHLRTVIHPTAPVAPGLLALAERQPVSGAALLHALTLGIEAACRIGNAVSPSHYRRGWHITATCGIFGAALAAGRLLGLDRQRMLWALGAASAQSSGLVEPLGFMAKSVGVGNAARNGVMSALLAQAGLDGPPRPLEGERGFLRVTADVPRPEEITDALGQRWEALANVQKPYPCGIVLNPVIDACLELRETIGAEAAARLRSVTLAGHPLLRQRADRPAVTTGREAQVSAQHAAAACLVFGRADLDAFSDRAVADPRVQEARRRIALEDDAAAPVASVRLTAQGEHGPVSVAVEAARGTEARPMSDAEIEGKVRTLGACGPTERHRVDALIERTWRLDREDDVGALLALVRPAA